MTPAKLMNATLPALFALAMASGSVCQDPSTVAELRPESRPSFTFEAARHLLSRAGFGGTPAEISRLQALGRAGAVNHLLRLPADASALPPHGVTPGERPGRAVFRDLDEDGRRQLRQKLRRTDVRKLNGLRAWWVDRMLRTTRPLEEKMTLFWHGHFTSGYRDVRNAHHMAVQNDLFRQYATGNFAQLVLAIAKDPAMLEYLDNNRNNRRAPNENFARELMELFTLGEGNYTEQDIKAAARAFTGWTFRRGTAEFVFARRNHDFGEKTFLGHTGRFNGEEIIEIILEQAAAPRHLAKKLLAFFAVEPTAAELEPYAQLLRDSEYELQPFFRQLFNSDWFYSDRVRGRLVKSPIVLAVSMLRMMGRTELPAASRVALVAACRSIGQELLQPPNVKGWDGGPAWITSSNLLSRGNLTRVMISGVNTGRRPGRRRGNASSKSRGKDRGKRRGKDRSKGRSQGERGKQGSMQDSMQGKNRDGGRRNRRRAQQIRALRMIGNTSPRFLSELRQAGLTETTQILAKLEQRFLNVTLAAPRRQALLDFLDGKDGSPALALRDGSPRWATKIQATIHLLTATPEFQVH